MKLYYFYTPAKLRNEEKKHGVINFDLDALYCEDAYSDQDRKQVKSFKYFDSIRAFVSTRTKGRYNFKFETGNDLCTGHYAKTEKELLKAYHGAIRISEKNYIRLRKVAIGLMFRHSEFLLQMSDGESKYLWCNNSYNSFWDIRLTALHYKYNSKGEDTAILNFFKERNLPLYDCNVPEEIRIHIAKPDPKTKERRFKCTTFEISGYGWNVRYYNFQDAIKSLKSRNSEYAVIQKKQYERIRKICKALMFEYCELEIEELKKPQAYSVRILNQ